jgi:hypothetical protein
VSWRQITRINCRQQARERWLGSLALAISKPSFAIHHLSFDIRPKRTLQFDSAIDHLPSVEDPALPLLEVPYLCEGLPYDQAAFLVSLSKKESI